MKYTLKVVSDSDVRMCDSTVRKVFSETYSTEDKKVAIELLDEIMDCPKYPLTVENIKENIGIEVDDSLARDMIVYYGFKKIIYGDILKDLSDGMIGSFKYEIPEEVNGYVVEDSDLKQYEYSIQLTVEK